MPLLRLPVPLSFPYPAGRERTDFTPLKCSPRKLGHAGVPWPVPSSGHSLPVGPSDRSPRLLGRGRTSLPESASQLCYRFRLAEVSTRVHREGLRVAGEISSRSRRQVVDQSRTGRSLFRLPVPLHLA
jgi:hypothetical protein